MLDTVLLESPSIDAEKAAQIEAFLKTRRQVDNQTGEVEYQFVSGSLRGSWDSSVAVNVKRQRWVSRKDFRRAAGRVSTTLEDCLPYLTIEGSVHKAILGHNVYGGSLDPVASCRWFVSDVSRRLGLELPCADAWMVSRMDWAEVFDLGSFVGCTEYIHGLRLANYPRRKPYTYGDESLMFPGSTTTMKAYHKGIEFSRHDFARLSRCVVEPEITNVRQFGDVKLVEVVKEAVYYDVAALQDTANRLLRFEVSIKSRKLKADFGEQPTVVMMTRDYLEGVHDGETARIVREGKDDMETVRKHNEVNTRLHQVYDARLANDLFGVWLQLAALGEKATRQHIPRSTFYRLRKQLQDAGISWNAADVQVIESASAIPVGFSPVRSDPRRLIDESPEVVSALRPYLLAA
jgi:II/X family phage/plasmid replication protein